MSIDLDQIQDEKTFHQVFAETLGFPDWYGRNMEAWIDCMSSLALPEDGMTRVHTNPGETLYLILTNADGFAGRCPRLHAALIECAAFVNYPSPKATPRPNTRLRKDSGFRFRPACNVIYALSATTGINTCAANANTLSATQ